MSPVLTRSGTRTSTGAGVIAILLLVLAFGNQAYVEWASRHAQGANAWDLFLRTLAWPRWYVTSGGEASRNVIAYDIRALLLIVFVAALLGMMASHTVGGLGAFAVGWFAVIISAAVAALLTAFITTDTSLYNALGSAADASTYGLFVGWIVGIMAALTRRPAVAAA
jgi:hypothetical protein